MPVGSSYPNPESGWRRYNQGTLLSYYPGGFLFTDRYGYNWSNRLGLQVKIFTNRIRVIGYRGPDRATNARIVLDGMNYYMPSMYGSYLQKCCILEISLPEYREYTLEVYSGTNGSYSNLIVDAIDVDSGGWIEKPDYSKQNVFVWFI